MPTPPTTTAPPPKPDGISETDQYYAYTSDYSVSTLHETLEDVSLTGNHEETYGPFGFGTATSLRINQSQCLRRRYFVPTSQACVYSPKDCADGLSMCIWERPFIHKNIMNSTSPTSTYEYIISTGGDDKGHPGFAIYHDLHWLTVIISTGEKYWKTSVLGVVRDAEWNNIGVSWKESEGLKVYINKTLCASTFNIQTATPLEWLYPSELILGCHRDATNMVYRSFLNGDIDEFAFWERKLDDSELDYFYGGFKDNISEISGDLLNSYLPRLNMASAEEANIIASVFDQISNAEQTPTSASPTAASDGFSSTATSPTAISRQTTPKADPQSIEKLRSIAEFTERILDPDRLPYHITADNLDKYMKVSKGMNNLMDENKGLEWLAIHENKNSTPGIMDLISDYSVYNAELIGRTIFTNVSDPFCKKNNRQNLIDEFCKMTLSDMKQKGSKYVTPTYDKMYKEIWNGPFDKVAIPTGAYLDERCNDRFVSISSTVYDDIAPFAEISVNPASLNPTATYFTDSRIITFNVFVSHAYRPNGEVDTSQPLCDVDREYLRKYPFTITMEHLLKTFALRTLLFHEDELVTDVEVRRCVWWNYNISNGGGWDTEGCRVLETKPEYTKCGCNHLGIFVILAEKTSEKTVPEDPSWLPTVKYILYGISAIAILLYIIAVAISGDLKEQFHLMGLNLAVSILLGSIAMVLSDMEGIKTDRHTCVAFGTLMHFFYGAVGLWMVALGHASFKAITAGVIGGRLKCYMLICWGYALIFIGIPLVAFLHELGTDPRCFIGWINAVKFVFFVPQIICALASLFYAFVILLNLSHTALRKENLIEDYGSFCRGAALLLILLSVTWIIGLFAYIRFSFKDPLIYAIFQLLNSIAGLCLFLCIGVGSSKFRSFVTGQVQKRHQTMKKRTFNEDKNILTDPADQRICAS